MEVQYKIAFPTPGTDGLPLLTLAALCFLPNATAAACGFEAGPATALTEVGPLCLFLVLRRTRSFFESEHSRHVTCMHDDVSSCRPVCVGWGSSPTD